MNAIELKEYIIENNKIDDILESLGCHKIKYHRKDEIRCALPDHNNSTSVRVKLPSLSIKTFDDDFTMSGDLYSFIMKLKNIKFYESIKLLHNFLNLKYNGYKEEKKDVQKFDILSPFKNALKIAKSSKKIQKDEMSLFSDIESQRGIEYLDLPHIDWIREGILAHTHKKFNIGYDIRSRRILIPHRLWCGDENDYVGIIGRTTNPNYEMLDIPKYCSMREEKYPKTMNVYGLQENYEHIQDEQYTVVFEAEKSVLKRHSVKDFTGVAICGHDISDEQAKILISLNVDIIIAMDKGISLFNIRKLCEIFYGIRNVYYMYDKYDAILKGKDSPADLGDKLYKFMFKHKVKYDENEHNEYIKEVRELERVERKE